MRPLPGWPWVGVGNANLIVTDSSLPPQCPLLLCLQPLPGLGASCKERGGWLGLVLSPPSPSGVAGWWGSPMGTLSAGITYTNYTGPCHLGPPHLLLCSL